MRDIYTRIKDAPAPTLPGLMAALELRAADPQQRAMRQRYLLKAEARRRVASGEHFGHIACMSLVARTRR